ncbi:MAG: lipopolysaccharide transport periplasmic protein LptA [Desulfobulbaceae bacterium]|nr:lipopolysaccharide transport periplasmic protein LptA [Desulfobulbaceae bacterium]HIJ89550.1 lipopolysaccharide transport periplasmic protein LptA [Deltaproteobacteria bacterium]
MKPLLRFFCRIVLLCPFLAASPGLAAPAPATGKPPIHIEADRMVSMKNENAVLFTGNVAAKQGQMVIRSEEMTVYYLSTEEKAKLPQNEERTLKKLFATGNVEIQNDGMTGTGDKMEYYEAERKIILIGDSKVWQDNNLVTGHTVVVFLDQGKSIVERGEKKGERVKAFFYPGGEGSQNGQQK